MREPTKAEFSKMCGYNFSKIPYPFKRSKSMQSTWVKRQKHGYDFPESFIPEYSEDNTCELHGHRYDENDDNLIVDSDNCIIFSEKGVLVFDTKVMCRRTVGNCNCRQRYDGHPQLLWHLGKGKFLNYSVLVNMHHNFINGGLSIHAQFKSIQDNAESFGVSCSLTYDDLHRASVGFTRNLEFDLKTAFSCPKHGVKPKWIIADGKNLGPTKRKCKDIVELDSCSDDDQILNQSTVFKDRVFLSNSLERSTVCSLLGNQISKDDFVTSPDISEWNIAKRSCTISR